MMYQYQKSDRYFAQAADDVKELALDELRTLGAVDISPGYRGMYFSGGKPVLYAVNYQSRLVSRVLAPLVSFYCKSDQTLYKNASRVRWEDFLDASRTFAVFATVSHSTIRHSKFAALRLKDAVVDYFRKRTGKRPSIDTRNPDVWFNLHIARDEATISLDTSEGSLHRRGYRKESLEAPMVETLAAALIRYSGWDGRVPLYDPFCGSGTLLCEAFMAASRIPAAMLRGKFGFERLPDFDARLWNRIQRDAKRQIKPLQKGLITGSDISLAAVKAAAANCSMVDERNIIKLEKRDVFNIRKLEGKEIFCNPPYGIRMGDNPDLHLFYKRLGDFLKNRCRGSRAFIYFGDRKHIKHIGLKPSWRKPFSTGGLDGRLVKYELY